MQKSDTLELYFYVALFKEVNFKEVRSIQNSFYFNKKGKYQRLTLMHKFGKVKFIIIREG